MNRFECTSYGKWILCGEHAVLRGAPALVFPLRSRAMKLSFQISEEELGFSGRGEHGRDLELLFWGVVETAIKKLGRHHNELKGHVTIESGLPLGRGLGASASLCVVVGRWFSQLGWIKDQDLYEFCRQLENLFHGESSGVDIAVALENRGLHFERNNVREPIDPVWAPKWYLSYSGKIGVTSECVNKVKEMAARDFNLGRKLDDQMAQASMMAERALLRPDGFGLLVEAISMAADCFEQWGLADGILAEHMRDLKNSGAVAVKPTGSGAGGYVLSLWSEPPSENLSFEFVEL